MKTSVLNGFTNEMQNVPAQVAITGDCVKPALAVLDAVNSELTALVVVRRDGSKAVVAIPGMSIDDIVTLVAAPMELAITDVPEDRGGLWVNRAIPKSVPVEQQLTKVVEEGGYTYTAIRTILGFGFGNRFGIVEVLIPNERRQEAKSFLYRVQRCQNWVTDGVKPDGVAQIFGNQSEAVAFAYGQEDSHNLFGAAKSAQTTLYDFVGKSKDYLYASPCSRRTSGRRMHFASSEAPMATLGDLFNIEDFAFGEVDDARTEELVTAQ